MKTWRQLMVSPVRKLGKLGQSGCFGLALTFTLQLLIRFNRNTVTDWCFGNWFQTKTSLLGLICVICYVTPHVFFKFCLLYLVTIVCYIALGWIIVYHCMTITLSSYFILDWIMVCCTFILCQMYYILMFIMYSYFRTQCLYCQYSSFYSV